MSEWTLTGERALDFWRATPRDYAAAIKGAIRRAEIALDRDISLAYRTANFTRADKLKPLARYLPTRAGQAPAGQVDAQQGLALWAAHLRQKAKA